MPRILVFSGSTRPTSLNRRLAAQVAMRLASAGAEVTEILLSDYPPLLKNALDWASICNSGKPGLAGKVVALGSASRNPRGGYRALTQFRSVPELGFGALVIPEMVPMAVKALPAKGGLEDQGISKLLEAAANRLVKETSRIELEG